MVWPSFKHGITTAISLCILHVESKATAERCKPVRGKDPETGTPSRERECHDRAIEYWASYGNAEVYVLALTKGETTFIART